MVNIAICDDNISMTGKIDMLLQKLKKNNGIDIETEVFWDGKDLVHAVEQGNRYDIIYLDIEMKKMDGITAAMNIRNFDKNTLIIYITSHETYMKKSFDVRPFRFIVKPVKEEEFISCFKAAFNEILSGDFYFRFRYQRTNYKIAFKDILYFESQRRKIFIITKDGTQLCMYGKLNNIEQELKKCKIPFLRIHQSFLVNYKHINRQSYDFLIVDNDKKLPISEDRRKMISEQYCKIEDMTNDEF